MNRPSNKGLYYDTDIDGCAFDDYIDNLEKYCDELEASIKYILLHMQRDTLVDECEGCMCKWYCKGEKSVLQEWCEQMDSKLFKQGDLPNSTELQVKWEPEFKKLKEDQDKITKALDKAYAIQKEWALKDEQIQL